MAKPIYPNKLHMTGLFKSETIKQIVIFVLSFLTANIKIMDSFSPFGVAFTAALPWKYSFFAFAGSLMGYIVFGSLSGNFYYIITLCGIITLKFVFNKNLKLSKNPAFWGIISFSVGIISALALLMPTQINGFLLVQYILENIICAAMTFFCGMTYKVIASKNPLSQANSIQTSSAVVVGCAVLLGICNIQFYYLNLGRIIAILVILISARKKGISGGAVSSVITGIVLTFYDSNFMVSSGLLISAGFMAGVFMPLGKLIQSAIFIAINTLGVLLLKDNIYLLTSMVDVFAATTLFMFVPERIVNLVAGQKSIPLPNSMQPQNTLSSRLEFSSKTLADLQTSVEKVSEKLKGVSTEDIFTIYTKSVEKVCRKCGLNTFCWVKSYNETMRSLNKMTYILKRDTYVTKETAPAHFKEKCCKLDDLLTNINYNYRDFAAHESSSRRVDEVKSVALEQFEAVVNMLMEMSNDFNEVVDFDDNAAKKTREIMQSFGIVEGEICCLIRKYGRMGIEVYTNSIKKVDLKIITSELSQRLERQFDIPSVICAGGKTKLSFFEQAAYTVDFYSHQIPEGDNKICGDACEYFVDSKGFAHMILSDGMGSGGRAAVDSVMVCALILRLIKAGFGFNSAIKFINSSFLIKSHEESLATIDIGCIDMYTGSLELLKAGAATSFIAKGKTVLPIKSGSLPIGILQGVKFEKNTLKLSGGDLLIMVSDGVTASGEEWIAAEIEQNVKKPVKEIAQRLCNEANRRRLDGHSDDITVLAARIVKV